MVKSSPYLRRFAALSLLLTLAGLCGCEKTETSSQAPASPSASATPPAQKPVIPNSFDEVTAQLDPGGDFYLYLSTEQWLGKLSQGIDSLHDLILSGSAGQSAQDRDEEEKGFALAKDVVQKSGLEEITGLGVSSFNISPGLYRNKIFLHHYADKGSGILWSIYGKAPHPLAGLDLLPVDTGFAGFGDFDLAQLINFLRQEADQSGIPEMKQAVAQWQTQFSGVSGLQLDDVLGSLNGAMGMVLTLDASDTVSIPVGSQAETIPTPRLAILIAVKNDLVFKRVDAMLAGTPGVSKVDEPELRMRTMPLPIIPGVDLRPSVAQWNGYLVVASDDKIIRDIIAVQKGGPGFKSTLEYAALSAGLPQQGNSIGVCTERCADTIRKFQSQMLASQPGASAAQAAFIDRFQNTGHAMYVGSLLPTGWLSVGQGSQGSSQLIAPMLIAPAAIAASLAIPAYTGMHQRSFAPPNVPSPAVPPSPPATPGTTP